MSGSARVGAARSGSDIGQPGDQWEQCFDAAQPPQPAGAEARHQRTQRFRERLVRRAEVLVAAAVKHDGALLVGLPGPFAGQTRLADAGFAGDQHRVACRRRARSATRTEAARVRGHARRTARGRSAPRAGRALHGRIGCGASRIVVSGLQAELENVLRAREVAQLAHPEVGEHNVVGQ